MSKKLALIAAIAAIMSVPAFAAKGADHSKAKRGVLMCDAGASFIRFMPAASMGQSSDDLNAALTDIGCVKSLHHTSKDKPVSGEFSSGATFSSVSTLKRGLVRITGADGQDLAMALYRGYMYPPAQAEAVASVMGVN